MAELADHVYSFGFFPLNADEFATLPADDRVGATIAREIGKMFSDHLNIVLFMVDHEDKRHQARMRKFEFWYEQYRPEGVNLYTGAIAARDFTIYSAMLVHNANPHRTAALRRYFELLEQLSKE